MLTSHRPSQLSAAVERSSRGTLLKPRIIIQRFVNSRNQGRSHSHPRPRPRIQERFFGSGKSFLRSIVLRGRLQRTTVFGYVKQSDRHKQRSSSGGGVPPFAMVMVRSGAVWRRIAAAAHTRTLRPPAESHLTLPPCGALRLPPSAVVGNASRRPPPLRNE